MTAAFRRRPCAGIAVLVALLLGLATTGCGRHAPGRTLTVVVSTSLTKSPWIGRLTEQGARLGVDEVNRAGGVRLAGTHYDLKIEVLDHANSPQTAQEHARRAVSSGAVAFITDGVGAVAVAAVTGPAKLPTFVTFDGGQHLADTARRPTLFRMAPANKPMAVRLTDYIAGRHPKVAMLFDDSEYGQEGAVNLRAALVRDELPVLARVPIPARAGDLATQVLTARRSGADTLLVWAGAPALAAVVKAARIAQWDVPIFASPTAEDPLVRQSLADHPEWLDGLTFVSFRITSEVGPGPFNAFRAAFEKRFGPEKVGVTADGREVIQPPDWSMYPYDSVKLLAAALNRAGQQGQPLIDALNSVTIAGANGDERNFSARNHEGVSSDDMYFAVFHHMRFTAVTDDLLSKSLPPVDQ